MCTLLLSPRNLLISRFGSPTWLVLWTLVKLVPLVNLKQICSVLHGGLFIVKQGLILLLVLILSKKIFPLFTVIGARKTTNLFPFKNLKKNLKTPKKLKKTSKNSKKIATQAPKVPLLSSVPSLTLPSLFFTRRTDTNRCCLSFISNGQPFIDHKGLVMLLLFPQEASYIGLKSR